MRTTLDIDDDILQAAKELGERENRTAGQVLSDWLGGASCAGTPMTRTTAMTPSLSSRMACRFCAHAALS